MQIASLLLKKGAKARDEIVIGRHGVELGDALIAATAVANSAELWTRNRKHYSMKELSFFD